jgi:hypothetical protein
MVPKTSIPAGPPGQRPTAVLDPPEPPPADPAVKPDVRQLAFPRFTPDFADLLKMVKEEAKADYAGWWRFRADWENSDLSRMPKPGVNSTDFYGELRGVLLVGKPEMVGDTEEWPVELPNVATVSPANVTDPAMLPHLMELLYTRCMNRCMRGFVGNRRCSAEELPTIKADDFLGAHAASAPSSQEAAGQMMQSDIDRQIRVALKAAGVTEHFLTMRFHAVLGSLQPGEAVSILRTLRQMTNEEYRAKVLQEFLQKHGPDEYAQSVLAPEAQAEPPEAPKAEPAKKTKKTAKKEPENVVKVEPAPVTAPSSGNGETAAVAAPPPPVPSASPNRGGFFGGQRI